MLLAGFGEFIDRVELKVALATATTHKESSEGGGQRILGLKLPCGTRRGTRWSTRRREEAVGGEGARVNPWPHILTDGVGVSAAGCLREV